jgi:hypothetical protein
MEAQETQMAVSDSPADAVRAAGDEFCAELRASERRIIAAIEQLRMDLPLLIRNLVLEQLIVEKQRIIRDLQNAAH